MTISAGPSCLARRTERQAPRLLWRGRAMGGSSTINGQIAIRAVPDDLDRWESKRLRGLGLGRDAALVLQARDRQEFSGRGLSRRSRPDPGLSRAGAGLGQCRPRAARSPRSASAMAGATTTTRLMAPASRPTPSTARPDAASPPMTAIWSRRAAARICGSSAMPWSKESSSKATGCTPARSGSASAANHMRRRQSMR